jgi:threonine aldolase
MANQIGVRLHAGGQGHLVAAETSAHIATTEVMTSAVLAGIAYRTGHDHPHGYMTAALAERLLEPDDYFDVEVVDALGVENTVGAYGGTILPSAELRSIRDITDRAGVGVHLDGARVWNAVAATGEDVRAWTDHVDTMMFCLSKGLGAPIGSVLCGPADLIREATASGSCTAARGAKRASWPPRGCSPWTPGVTGSWRTMLEPAGSVRRSPSSCPAAWMWTGS